MITGQIIAVDGIMQGLSYVGMFVLLSLGYLPIIGSFLPGSLILFFGGFLAKAGSLNIFIVLIVGILAILLGDFVSYSLGKIYGTKFLEKYSRYFFIKKNHVEKSYKLVDKHTGKSIILGKFNPLSRMLVPFIVGAHKIDFSDFLFYDLLGCMIWVGVFTLLGCFFGHSYNLIENLSILCIGIIILMIIAYCSYYYIKKYVEKFKNGDNSH